MITSDTFQCLCPLEKILIPMNRLSGVSPPTFSKEIVDIAAEDVLHWPMPCLEPLLAGLCKRYLDSQDDVAMIGAEQLVDGMDLDIPWCERNLASAGPLVMELARNLVTGKASRIDYFSDNKVTCFIKDEEEAHYIRKIRGYEGT